MTEEEIINQLKKLIGLEEFNKLSYKENKAIQGLLDLYKKEKEKNGELEKEIECLAIGIKVLGTNPDITTTEIIKGFTQKPLSEEYINKFKNNYISKNKIREIIKELELMTLDDDYIFRQMRDYAILILGDLLKEN